MPTRIFYHSSSTSVIPFVANQTYMGKATSCLTLKHKEKTHSTSVLSVHNPLTTNYSITSTFSPSSQRPPRSHAVQTRYKMATPLVHHKMATPLVHQKMATPLVHHKMATPLEHHKMATPLEHHKMATPLVHHRQYTLHHTVNTTVKHHARGQGIENIV